ncbi:BrnT family toxin [Bordetella avium]|uniref:Uncharacterized protein n=1 Tax=Bordetella avium (strain 197N) TaxID=360910 RepID=Q2KVN3_BORA1|nr:BrnT family toxin [Bordetella avium]RIQ17167.1 BrnT family toxin [Bordetella avium]RIQ36107.1 BrnT family toxin [Bordetella avium]RIQ54861.1 BrnT family toxin [Bordetella avium]RIQ70644.1 BrnT family toxin [Bordetella avium]CAJ48554.1 conserved hypothetical protein [Bordetella avium 197N]
MWLKPLTFELVHGLDWNGALVIEDARQGYSEVRYQTLGKVDERLYMLVFTVHAEAIRVIRLRKANSRKVARYEKTQS